MFSVRQKREIADAVQQILRATEHPELPKGEIEFTLTVLGAESCSWAQIKNNGAVIVPNANPHNEAQDDGTPHSFKAQCQTCDSLQAELAEDEALRNRMASLLTQTANVLKGKPEPLKIHDWSDLPLVAGLSVEINERLQAQLDEVTKDRDEWIDREQSRMTRVAKLEAAGAQLAWAAREQVTLSDDSLIRALIAWDAAVKPERP